MKQQPKTYSKIGNVDIEASNTTLPDRDFRDAWQLEGDVVTIDWVKARENFRKTASLSKIDFCLALVSAGVLTSDDAIEAAKGNWPSAFDAAFAGVDADVALRAKVEWAAASNVVRRHDMFDQLIAMTDITPKQLDAIFGYQGK